MYRTHPPSSFREAVRNLTARIAKSATTFLKYYTASLTPISDVML